MGKSSKKLPLLDFVGGLRIAVFVWGKIGLAIESGALDVGIPVGES